MDSIPGLGALKHVRTTQNLGWLGRDDELDGQPLSPMAQFFHESGSNVYMVGIMGFTTKLQPEILKPIFMRIFVKHPRFSSLQVRSSHLRYVTLNLRDIKISEYVPALICSIGCRLKTKKVVS